jgi:hypothetical protein
MNNLNNQDLDSENNFDDSKQLYYKSLNEDRTITKMNNLRISSESDGRCFLFTLYSLVFI